MAKSMGASLYIPANHKHLMEVADGDRLGHTRSLIFCTEDAVADSDLSWALFNLSVVLANMKANSHSERFVRVRNPEVLARVLAMPGVEKLTGFVIPKCTRHNFDAYFKQVRGTEHMLMPTLETADVFNDEEMRLFREVLEAPGVRSRILALRIGGNDLLALLGLRRPRTMTIYRTPLGPVIARLVTTFRPYGFVLTAPVFEHLDLPELLDQEVAEDMAYGMVGKTAIHPSQIAPIEQHYRVKARDLEAARAILDEDSPAVFKMHESMCEVATHRAWAQRMLEQSKVFGAHSNDTAAP
ncbi:HpcH/HpaI aldolase/citrate lyase family protein [Massilia sp. PAMC28688]|uniref:HpcH/HpaI aldolase/citrate lyase family protein n=1 Tax=Massilia sp. PAMC28688 TaxID=2861283 RepID=UPI001C635280|nr:HpcH/HpaI aldolase/citrate lyase family protein [Massilia sp. PAMC28688]QYF94830.1 HpcH/HpaI aldolase/citrate lyase family protein [Massilia sp. PAMC28688]